MKTILIINGHPSAKSYCSALAKSYAQGATNSGHHVVLLNLSELNFNYNQVNGLTMGQTLEPDLVWAQEKMSKANHIVLVHPVWWGSVPAVLKAFFDRVLLPGFAFKYHQKDPWWDKLLAGRTGHIIYTSDTPTWFYKWFYMAPSVNQVKKRTLEFCGIKPVKVTAIGNLRQLDGNNLQAWLTKAEKLGEMAC